jgi:hypothetical protein
MTADKFHKLAVLSLSSVQYAKIIDTFNPLKELGKLSEFKYKIELGNTGKLAKAFTQNTATINSRCKESISNMEMVFKPTAATTTTNKHNKSCKRNVILHCPMLAQKTKWQNPAWNACLFCNGSEVTSHWAYSNKCPQPDALDPFL